MKSLYIKQKFDITGPLNTCSFNVNDPIEILKLFKWKSGHPFQMGSKLKMDFIVVENHKLFNWQEESNLLNHNRREFIKSIYNEELPNIYDVDLDNYDLILTTNPFLPKEIINNNSEKLFITEPSEHWDRSLYEYENSYDLLWNYVPKEAKYQIPVKKPICAKRFFSRPYLTDYQEMQKLFADQIKNKEYVFVGWRTSNLMSEEVKVYFKNKLSQLNLKVKFTGINPFDQKNKFDSLNYWLNLSKSKYFIDVTCRLGQQLQDSASVSVINIGNAWRKDLIFSPNFIHKIYKEGETINIKESEDLIEKIKMCEENEGYYNKILLYQERIILNDEKRTLNKIKKNRKIRKI